MTGVEQLVETSTDCGRGRPGTLWTERSGRASLLDHTRRTLAGIRTGRMVGLAAVDLDDFEALVVACGDATGQIVLSEVAQRLVDSVAAERGAVWWDGSRYALMAEIPATPDAIQSFLDRAQSCVDQPVVVASTSTYVSARVGVTFSTKKTDDARLLLGTAEVACDRARRAATKAPVVLGAEARIQIHEEYEQGQALQEAIARNELLLRYQPIVDLQRRECIGLSTDLSWQPLNGDLTSDRDLFGLAERLGLSVQLGECLLRTFVGQWTAAGRDQMGASLSVTIRATSEQLGSWLVRSSDQLSRARAAVPGHLSIEIVEGHQTSGLHDEEALEWLHRLGIGVVLDDVGDRALVSSFRGGSVEAVRLGSHLVDHVHEGTRLQDLAAKLIDLAHAFGILTIAEGVRDQAQIDALTELGCDQVHSYFSSGSLPLDEATTFLDDGAPRE